MKIIRYFLGILALMSLSLTVHASNFTMYTPMGLPGPFAKVVFNLEVVTSTGVYTGVYSSANGRLVVGVLKVISWNGPTGLPAPTINLKQANPLPDSVCPGITSVSSTSGNQWTCYEAVLAVSVTGDVKGCPWLVSSQITTTDTGNVGASYTGPKTHNSECPSIPLATYDVSWDENTVIHKKSLNLQSTGGIIEKNLSTYLMESQKLCDGSQFDDRGANCRFVSQMITFTASGCDDAKVTVTPIPHPITDKQLHDIVVRVDTSALQPIDSTCRFQYVLNML